jgi:hypothetical protein
VFAFGSIFANRKAAAGQFLVRRLEVKRFRP